MWLDPYVGLLKDPVFMEILNACGVTAATQRNARVYYVAKSTVHTITNLLFGFRPQLANFANIGCPVGSDAIVRVTSAIASGQSVADALRSLFF